MNGNFSKWNKRITAWMLLLIGFYMGYMLYPMEYVLIFLGSGLAAIGLAVWQSVKHYQNMIKGNPPPDDEEDTPG